MQAHAPIECPFTILVDTAEQQPYTFTGLKADADKQYRPLVVPTRKESLGRYPHSLGDYSITECVEQCHVERKSRKDAQSTLLGFSDGQRQRKRFESELQNLSEIKAAMVVVECSIKELLETAPMYGIKTEHQNAKTLFRTVVAYIQDYGVPIFFLDDRRMAEHATFRFLERFWRKQREALKAEARAEADKAVPF